MYHVTKIHVSTSIVGMQTSIHDKTMVEPKFGWDILPYSQRVATISCIRNHH